MAALRSVVAVVGAGVDDGGATDVVSTTTGVDVSNSEVITGVDVAASVDATATVEGDGASLASTSRRCRVMGAAGWTTGAPTFSTPHCSFCSILRKS